MGLDWLMLERVFQKTSRMLMYLGGAGLILMMLNVTLDVFLKAVFNFPIQGTVEISSYYYMVAVVLLPLAFVEYEDSNINVDLIYNLLPALAQTICRFVAYALTVAVLSAVAWRTGIDAVRSFQIGEVVMGSREVIVWPARCILPFSFALAAFASLLKAVQLFRGEDSRQTPSRADAS